MSCGFCHVGPSPTHPPADPAAPQFANLSSSVGAQYMWVDRLFIVNSGKPEGQKNFMYQLAHTFRPGSMDTSLISTDGINNPRTMNAVYDFPSRMGMAARIGDEKLAGGGLDNKQFNDFPAAPDALKGFFAKPDAVKTPHVLKDGADSVGLLGALNRVYLNIGLFSEEWLLHFNAVIGGKPITPIHDRRSREKNSTYWQATEAGTVDTALFFLKAAQPDRLKDAPGGADYLKADAARAGARQGRLRRHLRPLPLQQGAARCPASLNLDAKACAGANYLGCFKRYWAYTQTDEYKASDARHRAGARLPAGQLPVDRRAHPRDAAAHQRLQPARHQRAGAATSGTTSRRRATRSCPRSARSRSPTRSPASPCPTRCPRAGAATRACRR